jgi:hypothetical protein
MPNGATVSCPSCTTSFGLEDGSQEIHHHLCEGCGRTLVAIWTDTMLLVNFSEWGGKPTLPHERYISN